MTLIVFLCNEAKFVFHKRNVILPCHLKGRALSCLKFICTLRASRLYMTKDINLWDRLGWEGRLGLGTGPCCLQLIGFTGSTSQHLLTGHSWDWGEARHYRLKEDKVKDREISRFALLIMWWAGDGAKNWIQISQVPDGFFHQRSCHIPSLGTAPSLDRSVSMVVCFSPLHLSTHVQVVSKWRDRFKLKQGLRMPRGMIMLINCGI